MHYTEELRSYVLVVPEDEIATEDKYLVGDSSIRSFDALLAEMFPSTIQIAEPPTSENPLPRVRAVLVVDIQGAAYYLGSGPPPHAVMRRTVGVASDVFDITYDVDLLAQDGTLIASWIIEAKGSVPHWGIYDWGMRGREAMRHALTHATDQLSERLASELEGSV